MSDNGDLILQIIRKIKAEINEKVNGGNVDGDTEFWVLLLVSDMHSRIRGLEKNPALILGKWFKDYPRLSWIAFGMASIVSIGGILAVIVSFLNKLGLAVIVQP